MTDAVDPLDLVARFLNTLDERTFTHHGQEHTPAEELTSPQALASWLRRHGLLPPGEVPGPVDLDAVVRLRTALRRALGAPAATAAPADALADALAAFPLHLAADGTGALRLRAAGGTAGLGVLVEAVATAVATGRWSRLKLCAAPDCRWAFHDTSRSGAGRWCSMALCGNRHKTRAYRRRRTPDADG